MPNSITPGSCGIPVHCDFRINVNLLQYYLYSPGLLFVSAPVLHPYAQSLHQHNSPTQETLSLFPQPKHRENPVVSNASSNVCTCTASIFPLINWLSFINKLTNRRVYLSGFNPSSTYLQSTKVPRYVGYARTSAGIVSVTFPEVRWTSWRYKVSSSL